MGADTHAEEQGQQRWVLNVPPLGCEHHCPIPKHLALRRARERQLSTRERELQQVPDKKVA